MSLQDISIDYPSVEHAECPYPIYDVLRDEAPVYRRPEDDAFMVSRYEDVMAVLRQPEVFASRNSRSAANPFRSTGRAADSCPAFIETDDPEHKPRRDAVFAPFAPRRLRALTPRVQEIADELIDGFAGRGEVELVSEFANLLPTMVVLEILGFEREDMSWLQPWGLVEGSGLAYLPKAEQARQNGYAMEAGRRMRAAILERYEHPREDGLTEMVRAQVERDGELDVALVLADSSTSFRGGIITTAHMLTMAMLMLLQHPDQLRTVKSDLASIPRMLDEALRSESPVQWIPRIATRDIRLGGVDIPAGARVLVMLASANRDERRFEDPEEFEVTRRNAKDHVAFGYGAHYCLGAPLARIEGRVGVERLFARLANLRLAPDNDLVHIKSPSFRGLERLNLLFDADDG